MSIIQLFEGNHDILISIFSGLIVSIVIVLISGEQKGKKKQNQPSEQSQSQKPSSSQHTETKLNIPKETEGSDHVTNQLKNSPRLRKFFGMKNDQIGIEEEIKENEKISQSIHQYKPDVELHSPNDDDDFIYILLSFFIYALAAGAALYLGNIATDGLFFKVLVGFFPKEAKTLKTI